MNKAVIANNRECQILIPQIIRDFRAQRYYRGSNMLVALIRNLSEITEEILRANEPNIDGAEWLMILEAIMEAQKNEDNILLADILEGDLLPYLEKLQILWQQQCQVELPDYLEENLTSIWKTNKDFAKYLEGNETEACYESFFAINGSPVMRANIGSKVFCLCSTINPEWEGEVVARNICASAIKEYWIFGSGMGYHVDALLKLDSDNKVTLLLHEIRPISAALSLFDWRQAIETGRLSFLYEENERQLFEHLKKKKDDAVFFIHYPSLRCVRDEEVRELLEDYFVASSSMQEQKALLDKNFWAIKKHDLPECGALKDRFSGRHVVISGGGPSVDAELETIKYHRQKMSLLIVGTVARKFLDNGIIPDAIIITDPQESVALQLKGVQTVGIPLIILSTAPEKCLEEYKGDVYVAYQEGYQPAYEFARENGYTVFQTGGSVVTLAVDMAIRFGAKDITLVGVDLAYTGGQSHANGVGRRIAKGIDLRKVLSVSGDYIDTSRNLDIYRKWIESRIGDVKCQIVYNTAKGARIKGTVEKKLNELVKEW